MGKHWVHESEFAKVTGVGDRAKKKSIASAAQSASTSPTADDTRPRNPREALLTHIPEGSFSPCSLMSLLSLLRIVSLNPNSSKARWRSLRELENLHTPHFTPNVFSNYSGSHARLKRGSEQRKIQELCFHSLLGIAHLFCCQNAKVQRKGGKKHGCGGGKWEMVNDMPHSECFIELWENCWLLPDLCQILWSKHHASC